MTPGASLSREKGRRGARTGTFCPCRRLLWYHPSERSESALNHHISRRLSALGVRPEEDITLAVAPRSECGALYRLERGGALRAFPAREASLC